MMNSYMRGHRIAYVENLDEPYLTPETALRPDTRYFWSVRIARSSGYGDSFQLRTS